MEQRLIVESGSSRHEIAGNHGTIRAKVDEILVAKHNAEDVVIEPARYEWGSDGEVNPWNITVQVQNGLGPLEIPLF